MARKGKWISGINPDQPVSEAARRALKVRLAVLWRYLPLAAKHADDDIEHVHQLRVASRRAVATLEMFQAVLPPRRARWLLKQLKRVRRAAGAARDDDVLALRLQQWQRDAPAISVVLRQVRKHRRRAQAPIEAVYRQLRRKDFKRRVSRFLEQIRWRKADAPEPCFATTARQNLRSEFHRFQAHATADFSDIEALHELRLASKRLRYAMELFAAEFPAEFRKQLYPQIARIQELLGSVNDHAVAITRLEAWLADRQQAELHAALATLAAAESAALAESREAFNEYWIPDRARSIERAFDKHLIGGG